MRGVLVLFAAMGMGVGVLAQSVAWAPPKDHQVLQVWPRGAPGTVAGGPAEMDATTAKDGLVAGKPVVRLGNVSVPTLTVYPPMGANNGSAVVVFPGGGYKILAIDLEGTEVCERFSALGMTCVLLKYRVPDTGPYPKSEAALQDAQRAMGIVRSHAAEWHVDPTRVGVLGFSAGAHLAAALSTHYDKRMYAAIDAADAVSCRPDFEGIIYPGYLAMAEENFVPNPEIHASAQMPPAFIVQAEDDPVHVENAVVYFGELKKAGVPAELHVYAQGGHGYGLRKTALPVTTWPDAAETWLRTIHMLPAAATAAR